jgi:cytochrome c2
MGSVAIRLILNRPNLSELLSVFYPKTFNKIESWDEKRLRRWLENPRAIKPGERMQPVKLSETEFRDILGNLRVTTTE